MFEYKNLINSYGLDIFRNNLVWLVCSCISGFC